MRGWRSRAATVGHVRAFSRCWLVMLLTKLYESRMSVVTSARTPMGVVAACSPLSFIGMPSPRYPPQPRSRLLIALRLARCSPPRIPTPVRVPARANLALLLLPLLHPPRCPCAAQCSPPAWFPPRSPRVWPYSFYIPRFACSPHSASSPTAYAYVARRPAPARLRACVLRRARSARRSCTVHPGAVRAAAPGAAAAGSGGPGPAAAARHACARAPLTRSGLASQSARVPRTQGHSASPLPRQQPPWSCSARCRSRGCARLRRPRSRRSRSRRQASSRPARSVARRVSAHDALLAAEQRKLQ